MPAAPGGQQVPRPQEVFISYSRKNKDFVHRLDDALKSRGREAWVDWEDIPPTEEFMQAIYAAIEDADTFVFVLTPDSVASVPCGREIAHAAANNKRMVPIVARDVKADTVPEALAKLEWIFYCRAGDDFEKATDKLISALDTDLKWVHAHTDLLTEAIKWEANSKSTSLVLRGESLKAAEQWLAQAPTKKEPKPTALQTEYINASRKAATRRLQVTLGAVILGFLVAIALAIFAGIKWREANLQKREAVKQEAKAKDQTKKTSEAASRGYVSLARYSEQSGKNAEALAQLAQALRLNPENREASGLAAVMLTRLAWNVPLTDSMRHEDKVTSARFSPDGQRVVTASWDSTARLWDVASGKPIGKPMKHQEKVNSAQFSPDGQRVLTFAPHDHTARLWDANSGEPIGERMKHEDWVNSAQFGPDGQRVVTASWDNTARLWDATSGNPIGEPMKHQEKVNSAQFNPDGQRVVTVSDDKTVRVWDATSGNPIGELMKHEGKINSAQFSPGSRKLLACDGGGIRGIISIEIVAGIDSELRKNSENPKLVLADYFDYVAGTSTGAMMAILIALGYSVDQLRDFYLRSGEEMFHKVRLWERFRTKSEDDKLSKILGDVIGEDTTLASEKLHTFLMMVLRNATTDFPWPLTNNPRAKYNDPTRPGCNLNLPLWQLGRASTAAPNNFSPEVIYVDHDFIFVDGGVTNV